MIFFALTLALVGASPLENALQSSEQMIQLFREFENEQGNAYGADESKLRLRLFRKSVKSVVDTNAEDLGWEAGLNLFSDMTEEEKQQYLGLNMTVQQDRSGSHFPQPLTAAPTGGIDWRNKGGVTGVKNQGKCGSCWTFGAVGSVEGVHKDKTGSLKTFAEQELLDCVYEGRRDGCQGGWMQDGFSYMQRTQRLADSSSVRYRGSDGACNYRSKPNGLRVKVTGMIDVSASESGHMSALNNGPIAVAFEVTNKCQQYRGGIFRDTSCSGSANHAVTMVGFDHEKFSIKNSWGGGWGSGGYIYMARNHHNCQLYSHSAVITMAGKGPDPGPNPTPGPDPGPDPNCNDSPACRGQGGAWLDWICRYNRSMCCKSCRNRG